MGGKSHRKSKSGKKDKDRKSDARSTSSSTDISRSSSAPPPGAPPPSKPSTKHRSSRSKARGGGAPQLIASLKGLKTQNVVLVPFGLISAVFALLTIITGLIVVVKLVQGSKDERELIDEECKNYVKSLGYTTKCDALSNRKLISAGMIVLGIVQIVVAIGTVAGALFITDKMVAFLALPYAVSHVFLGVMWVMILVSLYDIYFRRVDAVTGAVKSYDYDPEFFHYYPSHRKFRNVTEHDRFLKMFSAEKYSTADLAKFVVGLNAIYCLVSAETLFGIAAVMYKLTTRAPKPIF